MVFQSYALWPHMTVRKNIGYPLRTRRIRGTQATEWIEDVAALVDTSMLLDRYPAQLSGGQQQRIALSRGLVARPELVLFDEPLSNLDARLRDQVRTEIHELHARLGFTAVYVTHDQVEALALGDRLAIMRAGALEQLGDARDDLRGAGDRVRRRRSSAWRTGSSSSGTTALGATKASRVERPRCRSTTSDAVIAPNASRGHRPRSRRRAGRRRGAVVLPGDVVDSEFGGRHLDVGVTVGSTRLLSRIPAGERGSWARTLEPRPAVLVAIVNPRDLAFYDEAGELVSGVATGAWRSADLMATEASRRRVSRPNVQAGPARADGSG